MTDFKLKVHYFFGKFRCFFLGLQTFLKKGFWVSHLYMQAVVPAIIIEDGKSWRVSDNYTHKPGEHVHPNAGYIIGTCVRCGKEIHEWCKDFDEYTKYDCIGTIEKDDNGNYEFKEINNDSN